MSSNLIDLTLVEYSTSKLKTHIKRKVSPVGHSKCLQKVLRLATSIVLVLSKRMQSRAAVYTVSKFPLESGLKLPALWMAVSRWQRARHLKPSDWLTVEGKGSSPQPASVTILESGSSPPRATLAQKLPFVSAVTHRKFRMFWVSDTNHSRKQLAASRRRTKAGGQGPHRGSSAGPVFPT